MKNAIILEQDTLKEFLDEIKMPIKSTSPKLNDVNRDQKYISGDTAANMFDCDKQTIANLAREGRIKRYGRGRLIRYSVVEIKQAMKIVD